MPATSGKQLRLMYAAAKGKVKGVPKKVAEKYIKETPRKKRSKLMKRK